MQHWVKASGKRLSKALKAKSKSTSSSFEIKLSNPRGSQEKRKAACQTALLAEDRTTAAETLHNPRNMTGFEQTHAHSKTLCSTQARTV